MEIMEIVLMFVRMYIELIFMLGLCGIIGFLAFCFIAGLLSEEINKQNRR